MNQLIQKDKAGVALVPLPRDLPPTSVTAQLFSSKGVATWSPAHTVTHPSWATNAIAAAKARSVTVASWGTSRVPQPGEELFLASASTPASNPRESIVVDRVVGTTLYLREDLRLAWASGSILTPAIVRVPLTATDTGTVGRSYRVLLTATYTGLPTDEATEETSALLDVVAHVPRCGLTLAALQETYPSLFARLAGSLSKESGGWEALRDRAFGLVLQDINRTIAPDFIYSDSDLDVPTVQKMLWLRAKDGTLYPDNADRLSVIRQQREEYDRDLREALSNMGWVDKDGDAVPSEDEQRVSLYPRISGVL